LTTTIRGRLLSGVVGRDESRETECNDFGAANGGGSVRVSGEFAPNPNAGIPKFRGRAQATEVIAGGLRDDPSFLSRHTAPLAVALEIGLGESVRAIQVGAAGAAAVDEAGGDDGGVMKDAYFKLVDVQ
jgi:hypothetical protein